MRNFMTGCAEVRSRPGATWRGSTWIRPEAIPDDHGPARGTGQALAGPLRDARDSPPLADHPGRPEQVATARAFVARTLSSHQVGADYDVAILPTSEIVTNAIQHTKSGVDGGRATIVVIGVPHGVRGVDYL